MSTRQYSCFAQTVFRHDERWAYGDPLKREAPNPLKEGFLLGLWLFFLISADDVEPHRFVLKLHLKLCLSILCLKENYLSFVVLCHVLAVALF